MSTDLSKATLFRMEFKQDQVMDFLCRNTVMQEFSNKGVSLGKNEFKWETRVTQRVIRTEENCAHLLTISEPLGEMPANPIVPAQVVRQIIYAQMNKNGNILESAGGTNLTSYDFPDVPLVKDDEWEVRTTMMLPGMPNPAPCVNKYKVTGAGEAAGYECVIIEMASTEASFEMMLPTGQKARVKSHNLGKLWYSPELKTFVRIEQITKSLPEIEEFSFKSMMSTFQELVKLEIPENK